jgi:hypothetical protein
MVRVKIRSSDAKILEYAPAMQAVNSETDLAGSRGDSKNKRIGLIC